MTVNESGSSLPSGRIAGVDFGTKRIGIAITDAGQTIASPLTGYTRRDPKADAVFFDELAKREEITLFVVGLPLHGSGDESEKSREARSFGRWLHKVTNVPVVFFDERFSTVDADQLLAKRKLTKKQRDERRDMLAAQVILAAFLESKDRRTAAGPLEDDHEV